MGSGIKWTPPLLLALYFVFFWGGGLKNLEAKENYPESKNMF